MSKASARSIVANENRGDFSFSVRKVVDLVRHACKTNVSTAPPNTQNLELEVPRKFFQFKTVLLGESAVGKSCLAVRFVDEVFNEHEESTVGAAFLGKTLEFPGFAVKLDIWDTAGAEQFRELAPLFYRRSHAAILVYDVTNRDSFENVHFWIREICAVVEWLVIVAVVGNKNDMVSKRAVTYQEGFDLAESHGFLFFETSAKTGYKVHSLFETIAKKLTARGYVDEEQLLEKSESAENQLASEIDTNNSSCPPNSELVAGVCKCRRDLCEKPPCEKFLNLASIGDEEDESCCPAYTCDECLGEFLVDGECVCPESSALNSDGICECENPHESLRNDTCQCDLNKCPLPILCDDRSVGIRKDSDCCTDIECVQCPEDSYPKRYNDDSIEDKCVCSPCPETSCERGYAPKYVSRGRRMPRDCCDVYECVPVEEMPEKNCLMNYMLYHHLESWFEEVECKNCTCYNGEPICITNSNHNNCQGASNTIADDLQTDCLVNYVTYHHLDTWFEDECTNCTCVYGKSHCIANYCGENVSVVTPECPEINCKKFCKYGFKVNKKGCQICKCKLPDKINREMEVFMRTHNLTEDDVLISLRMYVESKKAFTELVSTTTPIPPEVVIPKHELLELFMQKHNMTEHEVLRLLDIHVYDKQEGTTNIKENIPAVTSTKSNGSFHSSLFMWVPIVAIAFVLGLPFGYLFHSCIRHLFACEETHENNNEVSKKFPRKPIEKVKHHNEKKPLTTT